MDHLGHVPHEAILLDADESQAVRRRASWYI